MAKIKTTVRNNKTAAEAKPKRATPSAAGPRTSDRHGSARGERRADQERRKAGRRAKQAPVVVERRKLERRAKVNRRRQIDPTTCERDYTNDELEFMSALDEYKRTSGRMFPTCSEMLEVFKKLGYEKRPIGEHPAHQPTGLTSAASLESPTGLILPAIHLPPTSAHSSNTS